MGNAQSAAQPASGSDASYELLQTEVAHLRKELASKGTLLAAQDAIITMQQQLIESTHTVTEEETDSTKTARQCRRDQPPLEHDSVLKLVFRLVGTQNYYYTASVNRK